MLSNRVVRYNVVNGISEANAGSSIGQLVRGDTSYVAVKSCKPFWWENRETSGGGNRRD